MISSTAVNHDAALWRAAQTFAAGPIDALEQIAAGDYNRVYRLAFGAKSYAIKSYPLELSDGHDRQGLEQRALEFFARQSLPHAARWIAGVPGFALLEWREAEAIRDIGVAECEAAIGLLAAIHHLRTRSGAHDFLLAHDACPYGLEITRQIDLRLADLKPLGRDDVRLNEFVRDEFLPVYGAVTTVARTKLQQAQIAFSAPAPGAQTLVPAGFGFANMRRDGSAWVYDDFTSFGWDDPVHVVADLIVAPQSPLTFVQQHYLREAGARVYVRDESFRTRLAALLPLFALRSAVRALAEFLPEVNARRKFAQDQRSWAQRKTEQLETARELVRFAQTEEPS